MMACCYGRAQGTTIEITLWRELAEKFYDHLEEGQVWPLLQLYFAAGCPPVSLGLQALIYVAAQQVYYFKRGNVKLANRNYQNVRNDYIIHMDNGCAHRGLYLGCKAASHHCIMLLTCWNMHCKVGHRGVHRWRQWQNARAYEVCGH